MKLFLSVAVGVFLGGALWSVAKHMVPLTIVGKAVSPHLDTHSVTVSYIDMISLMLTGVTVILAALGFVVAVLAIVGWKSISSIAAASAQEVVKNSLLSGGELDLAVRKEVRDIFKYHGIEAVDTEFDENGEENGA
ncbi:hypothetical protein [Leisingera thetidis]|uniref:hypothetical protein n=1 Tax=Leisingera thetidis TaxID=2930199 RepID=UPI0021F6AA06|nr:hypothetical protein [Leisingera thetidis]